MAPDTADVPATRLVLIRHGESQCTLAGIIGGEKGCTGLSPLGRAQAVALRDRLFRTGEIRADALYASVLPRAVETAEIVAPALGRDLAPIQDCDLCELHPGECDGMAWKDVLEAYRLEGRGWDPYLPLAQGGESWVSFVARAAAGLHRVVTKHRGRTVVVATHGGVVESSMVAFLGVPYLGVPDALHVINASITEWVLHATRDTDGRPGRWQLVRYNDAAHLADVPGPA